MSVELPDIKHDRMMEKWSLPLHLMGGIEKMRAAGRDLLPQEPKESDSAYENRLRRTSLFNVFKKVITSASGSALSQSLVIANVPEKLKYLEKNASGDGRSLMEIADDIIQHHLLYGKSHMIVDFPKVDGVDNMSYVDFKKAGYRPYFNVISPKDLIGWKADLSTGYPTLEHVRIIDYVNAVDLDNRWAMVSEKIVRVWFKEMVETYMYNVEDNAYVTSEEVIPNPLGYVPMVTGYANKTGFMQSECPLIDLAELNLTHYQSSSDQRNILHIVRVPFILAMGFADGELNGMELGANRIVSTTSGKDTVDMKFIEHTGKSIEAGQKDLDRLEQQMRTLGGDIIMGKSVDRQTATARSIDAQESMSLMQLTLRSMTRMIEEAYKIAGDWLEVDASGVTVSIGEPMPHDPNPVSSSVLMQQLPLTEEQVFNELKRRGIVAPNTVYAKDELNKLREKAEQQFAVQNQPEEDEVDPDSEEETETDEQ